MSDFIERCIEALADQQKLSQEYREEIHDELEGMVRVVLKEVQNLLMHTYDD